MKDGDVMSKTEQIILHSAQQFNILPITSRCDVRCVFCSHNQNSPEVETIEIPPRSMEDIERTMNFLDENKPIIIGESATKVIEGEPLSHPQFDQILLSLREKFPHTSVVITTNGRTLNQKRAELFQKVKGIEINLSLNSASEKGRETLMHDNNCKQSIAAPKILNEYGIDFHGSIVAMPHLVGWEDIAETIIYLDKHGTRTIRVFMPGYAKLAPEKLQFDVKKMHHELADFINNLANQVATPVLLEPPLILNLHANLAGVIEGSRAALAGLQRGDQVMEVNGKKPRSRVEAWHFLQQPGNIKAIVQRDNEKRSISWVNEKGIKSGVVVDYDIDLERIEEIKGVVQKHQALSTLLLCSTLAFQRVQETANLLGLKDTGVRIESVKSIFFGGSIGAAGLLTLDDIMETYEKYIAENPLPGLILLPREAFDHRGKDLTGRSYWELEEHTGVKVEVV